MSSHPLSRRLLILLVVFYAVCVSHHAILRIQVVAEDVAGAAVQVQKLNLNNLPLTSTAIVALHHYYNDYRDKFVIDGIRTMVASLREHNDDVWMNVNVAASSAASQIPPLYSSTPNTAASAAMINTPNASKRPIVVLVSANTPSWIRDIYMEDTLFVQEIDDNKLITNGCAVDFMKLYLWNHQYLPYDRVVYINSDILIQRPIGNLFDCGWFCMVYSSILHFTDGIIVVRPNQPTFELLLESYRKLNTPKSLVPFVDTSYMISFLSPPDCVEQSWHFFLSVLGSMEAAPLFYHTEGILQEKPIMRMTASVSLNAMMWYEFFTWRLMRGKEFRAQTDIDGIPAYSLSYTTLKPYNFVSGIFFNLNWHWSKERDRYLHRTYEGFFLTSAVLLALIGWIAFKGSSVFISWLYHPTRLQNQGVIRTVTSNLRSIITKTFGYTQSTASLLSLFYYWPTKLPLSCVSFVVSFTLLIINGVLIYIFIPKLTPPHFAWPIFICFHVLLTYFDLKFIITAYSLAPQIFNHSATSPGSLLTRSNDILKDEEETSLLNDEDLEADTQSTQFTARNLLRASQHTASNSLLASFGMGSFGSSYVFSPSSPSSSGPSYPQISFMHTMWAIILWESLTFILMRLSIYPEFVVKMLIIFPLVYFVLLSHFNAMHDVLLRCESDLSSKRKSSTR